MALPIQNDISQRPTHTERKGRGGKIQGMKNDREDNMERMLVCLWLQLTRQREADQTSQQQRHTHENNQQNDLDEQKQHKIT